VKAKVLEQLGERAACVEAQVISTGVEVGIEYTRRKRPPEHPQAPVVGRAQQQDAAGAQHTTQLR
jgi:hypothetical protein